MRIAGIDYSSHFIDAVFIDEDSGKAEWRRWGLHGNDAFDRARSIRDSMPARGWWQDEGVVAAGIEHPGGKYGTGPLLRIQGAILACLPPTLLVEPWAPAKWRKAVGLPGNASKQRVAEWATWEGGLGQKAVFWAQDACDAYTIAQATRQALEHEEAA